MSHETSSWTIEHNRLLEERALQAAWQLADECERENNALEKRIHEATQRHGAALTGLTSQVLPRPDKAATRVDVERYVFAVKGSIHERDKQLAASIAALDVGARLARLAPMLATTATTLTKVNIEERRKTAARIIGRLPGDVSEGVRQNIIALSERFVSEADDNTAKNIELALRAQIQNAQNESRQREQQRKAAVQLRSRLLGLEGPDLALIHAELARIEIAEQVLTPQLRQRIEKIEIDAKRRVDRQFASQVIENAFVSLGYSVEEGFETAFADGGAVRLQHPELHEYSVELESLPSSDEFRAHLVRESTDGLDPDGDPVYRLARDLDSEKALCGHLREARKMMNASGVHMHLEERIPPGTPNAVKVVAPRGQSKKRRAKAAANVQAAPIRR